MNSTTNNPLPDVHPGFPGNFVVMIDLCIRRQTLDATLVELPDVPSKQVWLPRRRAGIGQYRRWVQKPPMRGSEKIRFDVHTFHIEVWLYRKIRAELMEGGAA